MTHVNLAEATRIGTVEVSLDEVSKRFEAHLGIENNFRIVFSGPYGTGKSYFLRKYFDARKDKYNTFFLSPVNYVVSSNEDIFELIKVDIINKLFLEGHVERKKSTKPGKLKVAAGMVKERPLATVRHLVSAVKKVKPFLEIGDSFLGGIQKLQEEYLKYEKELSEKLKLDEEKLSDFVNEYSNNPGSIFEENFITKTINKFLEEISEEGRKENILIIDDLDRIDPEHLFRILNVLSAHNNYWDEKNKFRFHKIILVFDIENVQKIFEHKYGHGVDFYGYMDKFYSTDVFAFSNIDALRAHVYNYIGNDLSGQAKNFLIFVLASCIDQGKITLRKVLKSYFAVPNTNYFLGAKYFKNAEHKVVFLPHECNVRLNSEDLEMLRVIKILSMIWGDFEHLKRDVKSMQGTEAVLSYGMSKAVFDFLVLPLHIALNYEKGESFLVSNTQSKQGFSFDHPIAYLFKVAFVIRLLWTAGSVYDSKVGYFKEATVFPIVDSENTVNHMGRRMHINQITVTEKEFFEAVARILESFQRFKFLAPLGI